VSAPATGAERVEWDLGDLYLGITDPALVRDADVALDQATRFRQRFAARIRTLSAAELAEATAEFERIKALTFRMWLFAKLAADTDTLGHGSCAHSPARGRTPSRKPDHQPARPDARPDRPAGARIGGALLCRLRSPPLRRRH
jgi:hypothetical protein